MKFRTEQTPLSGHCGLLNHATPILMLGSCFTDSIGSLLSADAFPVCVNPFGPLYNPASIQAILRRLVDNCPFADADIVSSGNLFHTFLSHSKLSSLSTAELLDNHNTLLQSTRQFLSQAKAAILTFGSAFVYRHNASGQVVANCHKLPAVEFTRSLLSLQQATDAILESVALIRHLAPTASIILTISPIRHLADGLHGNQISKSTLMLAVNEAAKAAPEIIYFPSYEAVIDDLRDYRFYDSDLKHPSHLAVDYIYQLFSRSFFSPATIQLAAECRAINARLFHHPITADHEAIADFNHRTRALIDDLISRHPFLSTRFPIQLP